MAHQRGFQYDTPTKNRVVGAKLGGASYQQISDQFNIPLPSVKTLIRRFNKRGTVQNAPRSGRPPIITTHLRRQVIRTAKKNRFLTRAEIAKSVTPRLHPRSISRVLAAAGLHRRKARRVPFLTRIQRKIRLTWARGIKSWGSLQFKRIIWSDECYFYAGETPGSIFVTRAPNEANRQECMAPRFKKSQVKVMVWGCVMWNCKGPLLALDYPGGRGGGMTSKRYQDQVLSGPLLDFYTAKSLAKGAVYFQQDGAPCHTSKSTTKWLRDHQVQTFPHPSNSPDVNPIENIWWELKRRVQRRPLAPTSVAKLKQAVQEEWLALPFKDIRKYVSTMPIRVRHVISNKGGNTKF